MALAREQSKTGCIIVACAVARQCGSWRAIGEKHGALGITAFRQWPN